MADKETQKLQAKIAELEEEVEYHRKAAATESTHKSEAVKELFDFDRSKLPQRTRLNEKEILTFATLKTNMQILDPKETRMWPEIFMDNIMEMKISLKGGGRYEGMSIFQVEQESRESQEGYRPV